jgi:hypothetical protein
MTIYSRLKIFMESFLQARLVTVKFNELEDDYKVSYEEASNEFFKYEFGTIYFKKSSKGTWYLNFERDGFTFTEWFEPIISGKIKELDEYQNLKELYTRNFIKDDIQRGIDSVLLAESDDISEELLLYLKLN